MSIQEARLEENKLLVDFVRTRAESEFRRLYRQYSPALNQFLYRLCAGDQGEAEELLQESWVRALEKLDSFDGRSSFKTWLTGIAMNCYRENLRRKKSVELFDPSELDELVDSVSGYGGALDKASLIDLERAISSLPPGYRATLILHDLEGYTHKEIGEKLNTTSGTSKSQLFKARALIREKLMK